MASSVVESMPPSLPYNLTAIGPKPKTVDLRQRLPCEDVFPHLSQVPPVPSSPPPVDQVQSQKNLHGSYQLQLPIAPVSKLPSTVSRPPLVSPTPPPRPPRPQKSLPNLRPTLILEPDLIAALPVVDRPLTSSARSPSPRRPQALSPSALPSSDNSTKQFSAPLPSPAFFSPRTWIRTGPSELHKSTIRTKTSPTPSRPSPVTLRTSPVLSKRSSKANTPRCSPIRRSPTSPQPLEYYYPFKWQYDTIISSESLTALPMLPPSLPPPKGPLPEIPPPTASPARSPMDSKFPARMSTSRMSPGKRGQPNRPRESSPTESTERKERHVKGKKPSRSPSITPTDAHTTLYRQPSISEKIPVLPHSHPIATTKPHDPTKIQSYSPKDPKRPNQHYTAPPAELVGSLPHHLHLPHHISTADQDGDGDVTVDMTFPPAPLTKYQRHRRKIRMMVVVILVLGITAGMLAGILWRLNRSCRGNCGGGGGGERVLDEARRAVG